MIYLPKLCVGMIYLPKLCVGLVYSGSLSCGDTSNNFFQFYMAQFLLFRSLRVTKPLVDSEDLMHTLIIFIIRSFPVRTAMG
jgi:hypothetical protein